ncbi:MAG: zinc-binding alcohol dehydrogenase family protein [Candidatus Latescibacteria bacterium]|nr:zinc-binding alcohol dehydrogenase family protein [bacterium]MBD3424028.1 zinc-binding alcohol dehydrogenase family protein [Candidatus Latescibacterota bacterium]
MKAMILEGIKDLDRESRPLKDTEMREPEPGEGEILVRVKRCGVCHTELDEIEGRTAPPFFPVIPGHEIIGRVEAAGKGASRFTQGDRVGIAWIHSACGHCKFCRDGNDNLCREFRATGRDAHGGYAEYTTVNEKYAYPIPDIFSDTEAAPLMCAGAIGYRSLMLTGIENGKKLGLTGFGASAHLVLKMVAYKYPDTDIYVFARNRGEREFALELGAVWAGDTSRQSPEKLDAIIDTTPAWKPVVEAMNNLDRGGRLVINAIRKQNADRDYLLKLDYSRHLWYEKEIKSVANIAHRDPEEFISLAAEIPLIPETEEFELEEANEALMQLKRGRIRGAKVLKIG